jgi:hypothetical protein
MPVQGQVYSARAIEAIRRQVHAAQEGLEARAGKLAPVSAKQLLKAWVAAQGLPGWIQPQGAYAQVPGNRHQVLKLADGRLVVPNHCVYAGQLLDSTNPSVCLLAHGQ